MKNETQYILDNEIEPINTPSPDVQQIKFYRENVEEIDTSPDSKKKKKGVTFDNKLTNREEQQIDTQDDDVSNFSKKSRARSMQSMSGMSSHQSGKDGMDEEDKEQFCRVLSLI